MASPDVTSACGRAGSLYLVFEESELLYHLIQGKNGTP